MRLSICIIDEDSLRAETIKETLLEENYSVETFTSEVTGTKAIVERAFDVIFIALEFLENTLGYIEKLKALSPASHIVALTTTSSADKILPMSELGIKHYIETPINSINEILSEVAKIEADIMKTENKKDLFNSILEGAKALAKGKIPANSEQAKAIIRKADLALAILSNTDNAPSVMKGDLQNIALQDIVRAAGSIYKDGLFEAVSGTDKAILVLKNKTVIHCRATPSLEGLKAFTRIAGWEKGAFTFKNTPPSGEYSIDGDLATTDLHSLSAEAGRIRNWFIKKRKNLPPYTVQLFLNTRFLEKNQNTEFTPIDLEVLSQIIQYKTVKAILDSCKLTDPVIFDTFISLRKKGVLEVKF